MIAAANFAFQGAVAAALALDSVQTTDAAPTVAPHKVSNQTGKNQATVKFTPSAGAGYEVIAYRLLDGGVDQNTGTDVSRKGFVVGDGAICGRETVSNWSSPVGTQLTEVIDYAETGGGADGDRTVNLYVLVAGKGWL